MSRCYTQITLADRRRLHHLVSASHVLDVSTRQVRRLLERIRTGGAASIRHKAIGRPSNNRISEAFGIMR